jgi:beta-mannosidase
MPVPGDIHSALLAAGRIPDPYHGRNAENVRWVGTSDWRLERDFTVNADLLARQAVLLDLTRVDTFATVAINDVEVLRCTNFHRRWLVDVKPQLRPGANRIRIDIDAVAKHAKERRAAVDVSVPQWRNSQHPDMNFIRKPLCHAGWDWGVLLMIAGVYGDCRLLGVDQALIEHVTHAQTFTAAGCQVAVTARLRRIRPGPLAVTMTFDGQQQVVTATGDTAEAPFQVAAPRRWWPRGQGEQHLYDLTVACDGRTERQRIGLRTIELRTSAAEPFRLVVNDRVIPCRGANWIPSDALPSRQTDAVYDRYLDDMAAAHMNIVRVWGGGQFERTHFYRRCDELGIMVWQDMLFACGNYPSHDAFLAELDAELAYQIPRLRQHPSLVLWCGDNEIPKLQQSAWKKRPELAEIWKRLNGFLGELVRALDPTRPWWPSSPWDWEGTGDTHQWKHLWDPKASFRCFQPIRTHFCSEFGWQSFPSLDTVRGFTDETDIEGPEMLYHQKHPQGNQKIRDKSVPWLGPYSGLERTIYAGQLVQALAIEDGILHFRRDPGCTGTIYWQVNDNWPVASWSSIEYGGRWKLLHHAAVRFFAPVALYARQEAPAPVEDCRAQPLEIGVVCDRSDGCAVQVRLRVCTGEGRVLADETRPAALPGSSTAALWKGTAGDFLAQPDAAVLVLDLVDGAGARLQRKVHFLRPFVHVPLADPELRTEVVDGPAGPVVRLTAARAAWYVALAAGTLDGRFADNAFPVLLGEPEQVAFLPRQAVDAAALRQALRVQHLQSLRAP